MQAQDREKGSEAVQLCFKLVIDICMQFLNVFSLKPINPIAQGIKKHVCAAADSTLTSCGKPVIRLFSGW